MAKVVEPGRGPNYFPRKGLLRCKKCGCVFCYAEDDIKTEYDLFQKNELYSHVDCPNDRCRMQLVVHDRRMFGWLWRIISSSCIKAEFVDLEHS